MINKDELSYRRGTIVGLTMAEAIIIFVFILLLLLNHSQKLSDNKIDDLKKLNDRLEDIVENYKNKDALVEKVERIVQTLNSNSFDDAFKELVLIKENIQRLTKENLALRNKVENEKISLANSEILGKITPENFNKALKIVEYLNKNEGKESFEKNLISIENTIEKQEREKTNLQGQLSYLQKKFSTVGRGTEKPACWATSDGRPEYIFSIAMESDGLKLHRNEISENRKLEYAELPTKDIVLDTKINFVDFKSTTNNLYRWSNEKECRFFVKIFDLTKNDEKAVYKKNLRIIGEHFYYYEPVDEKYQLAKNSE
jgi:hypothetical protein